MSSESPWSNERNQALVGLWESGLSTQLMAARMTEMFGLEINKNMIVGRIRRLGLKREKTTQRVNTPALPVKPTHRTKVQVRRKPKAPKPVPVARPPFAFSFSRKGPQPPAPLVTPQIGGESHTVPLPLAKRGQHQCGWPVNDGDPFLFCAQAKAAGDPHYCVHHRQLSLQPERRRQYLAGGRSAA